MDGFSAVTPNFRQKIALSPAQITSFRRKILAFYRKHGRVLPFRETKNPYNIAIAEIMLQQTQVERVIPKYLAWIDRWPDWQKLAEASRQELLTMWSGLGYNRRALYLGDMARAIVERFGGTLPSSPEELRMLPGIGPYTANAILIFAFNFPLITIDTNIRRVLIHELELPVNISRKDLEDVARTILPSRRARDWHNALMDYSRLALPKQIKEIRPLSRQKPFAGSIRQIRGEIVRRLTKRKRISIDVLVREMERSRVDILTAADNLAKEGMVRVGSTFISLK